MTNYQRDDEAGALRTVSSEEDNDWKHHSALEKLPIERFSHSWAG